MPSTVEAWKLASSENQSVLIVAMFVAVFQLAAVLQMAVVHGVLKKVLKGFKNVLMSLFLDSSGERGPDSSGSTAGRDVPYPTARKLSFFIFFLLVLKPFCLGTRNFTT